MDKWMNLVFSDKWGFFTGQEFREAATRVCFGNLSLEFKRQQSLCSLLQEATPNRETKWIKYLGRGNRVLVLGEATEQRWRQDESEVEGKGEKKQGTDHMEKSSGIRKQNGNRGRHWGGGSSAGSGSEGRKERTQRTRTMENQQGTRRESTPQSWSHWVSFGAAVGQLCPPCSLLGSLVLLKKQRRPGIHVARKLEWVAISWIVASRWSSPPRDWTRVSCKQILYRLSHHRSPSTKIQITCYAYNFGETHGTLFEPEQVQMPL